MAAFRQACDSGTANMSRLVPDGFLTTRQAAERLAAAMYSGVPDRPVVKKLKDDGFDVADGVAVEDAVAEIWAAVDGDKLQALIIGAKRRAPLKLPAEMSKGIPGLRNPRGGGFSLLRHRNPYRQQIVEWFGSDLSTIAIVFSRTRHHKTSADAVASAASADGIF